MENSGSGRGWEGVAEGYGANRFHNSLCLCISLEREEIQRHNEL